MDFLEILIRAIPDFISSFADVIVKATPDFGVVALPAIAVISCFFLLFMMEADA